MYIYIYMYIYVSIYLSIYLSNYLYIINNTLWFQKWGTPIAAWSISWKILSKNDFRETHGDPNNRKSQRKKVW